MAAMVTAVRPDCWIEEAELLPSRAEPAALATSPAMELALLAALSIALPAESTAGPAALETVSAAPLIKLPAVSTADPVALETVSTAPLIALPAASVVSLTKLLAALAVLVTEATALLAS
ncbi:hypothetical protein BBJ29_006917, partial [Phytophthora kernoviae]